MEVVFKSRLISMWRRHGRNLSVSCKDPRAKMLIHEFLLVPLLWRQVLQVLCPHSSRL